MKPIRQQEPTEPLNGETHMRFFNELFDRGADADGRIRNQPRPERNRRPDDKEVITVDPKEVLGDGTGRPPIIFENGRV